jgi:hypothetical protein
LGRRGLGRGVGSGDGGAREVLDQALEIAVAEGLGLETYRATGLAHESILEMVRGGGFDLVVLGRGRGWISPFNVAVRVARSSPVDVLVIPQGWTPRFGHLACAAVGTTPEPVLDTALHLASLDDGRVTLFSLEEPGHPLAAGVTLKTARTPRELHRGLRAAARRESTDLVVFAGAPAPSVRLLRAARCPVWIVKV